MESLNSLHQYQSSILETVIQENVRLNEATVNVDLDTALNKGKVCYNKLLKVKRTMDQMSQQVNRMKVRVSRIQDAAEKRATEKAEKEDRDRRRDQLLRPVIRKPEPDIKF